MCYKHSLMVCLNQEQQLHTKLHQNAGHHLRALLYGADDDAGCMLCADLQVRALGAHPPKVSLPDDFHWQTYIKLWPDLKQAISTQRDAEDHYVSNGALEHRVYRDYPLAVRYTSCSGLINQHYSHLAGIALAMALQADTVIVPPALARDSFKSYFSTFAEKNEVKQVLLSMLTKRLSILTWSSG